VASNLVAEAQTGVRVSNAETLPAPQSLLSVRGENDVIVTALKPAAEGDAGIIRFWNPTHQTASVEISLARPISSAAFCDLNEEATESIALTPEGLMPVSVPAFGLSTVRFEWKE
jgi:alpha-mannosidase